MGYYTNFRMRALYPEWKGKPLEPSENEIRQLEEEVKKMGVFDPEGNYEFGWSALLKWYECEEDMARLSSRFPNFLFLLEGDGEEPGDIWGSYFRNGGIMRGVRSIITKQFDAEKLTPVVVPENNRYTYQEGK